MDIIILGIVCLSKIIFEPLNEYCPIARANSSLRLLESNGLRFLQHQLPGSIVVESAAN